MSLPLSLIQWGIITSIGKHYHGAAIQTFTHYKHEDYACLGPYIKDWMHGAASWHPSVIAHRLRASHHAYFWLVIWKEALEEILKHLEHRAADAIQKDIAHHLENNYAPLGPAVHKMDFLDDMKCYTNYQPRAQQEVSLKDRVLSGLVKDDDENGKGWKYIIYEDIVDHNLVKNSFKMGYADFKWLMFSKDDSVPLVLDVSLQRAGPVSVINCISRDFIFILLSLSISHSRRCSSAKLQVFGVHCLRDSNIFGKIRLISISMLMLRIRRLLYLMLLRLRSRPLIMTRCLIFALR